MKIIKMEFNLAATAIPNKPIDNVSSFQFWMVTVW
jgi:hypothetical protein